MLTLITDDEDEEPITDPKEVAHLFASIAEVAFEHGHSLYDLIELLKAVHETVGRDLN